MHDFRLASSSDLHHVARWIQSADEAELWAGSRISYPIEFDCLEQDLQFGLANSWVLSESDELCAFGQIVPKLEGRRHLARLIVNPDRRCSGLGRALATHLLTIARELGSVRISLNVDPTNRPALSLYLGLGFAESTRPSDEQRSQSLYLEHTVQNL